MAYVSENLRVSASGGGASTPGGVRSSGTAIYQPDAAAAPDPGAKSRPSSGARTSGTELYQSGGTAFYQPQDPKAASSAQRDAPRAPSAPRPPPMPAMTPTPKKGLNPGDHLRQYEIIRCLGEGGMGAVYLARDTKLGRRVAIKVLRTEIPLIAERFVLEARATARCAHENIVTLYEADTFEGAPYMVLEYIQGRSIVELFGNGKALPPSRVVALIIPVLRALACAHTEGIVHRDLKPENIMLTDAGVLKVLDFGIAKVLEDEKSSLDPVVGQPAARGGAGHEFERVTGLPHLTQYGMTVGTMLYMSPEQWRAEAIDHRTDIWAVGVMLFEMLAGRHPLEGLDARQMKAAVLSADPMPSVRSAVVGLSTKLAEAVDSCLQKDRDKRPVDVLTLLRALEPFVQGRAHRPLERNESPYAGLGAFQEANADLFFGRAHEIADVTHRLETQPLLAIVGPSGVGKSSFVRAGLVPALKRMGENWEALVLRPGRAPLSALASILGPLTGTGSSVATAENVAETVRREQQVATQLAAEPGHAGAVLRAHARRTSRKILLFVDQLEEVFTLVPDRQEQLAFTACIAAMADDPASPVRVVMSIRSDFLERLFEDPHFRGELRQGIFFLTTPGEDGLRDALLLPAESAGYRFESPEMVDELVKDLSSTDGALSLLQFAATQLWEARNQALRVLTRASYEAIGGIAGALARYADRVLDELSPEAKAGARELFLLLVTADRTRAVVSLEELEEAGRGRAGFDQLVDQLVQARLLVIQKSDHGSTAEIVHESLIHSWPRLRRWLDESGEDSQFLEQLRAAAKQWDAANQRRDFLWRGEIAEEARKFRRRFRGGLPALQESFLEAVLAQQASSARRKRVFAVSGISFLLVIAAASLVALVVIHKAKEEAIFQTVIAQKAEAASRDRAEALEKKEHERAEAARLAEEAGAALKVKNDELVVALSDAQTSAVEARRAKERAELEKDRAQKEKSRAQRETLRADAAAREIEARLLEEQARVSRLQAQLGSPIAETLPW